MKYQPTLFEERASEPLAARLRPRDLSEFVGQEHLLGEKKVLRRIIESDTVGSMIFWGPPGVGKTTLARIIANRTKARFIDFSAVTSGIKEIKAVMEQAESARRFGEKTIVFVDEIHRFNKAQQDAFLPYVERGSIILIGATTENPSFEVNGALLSRCKVFVLQALRTEDIVRLLRHALTDPRGFGGQNVEIAEDTVAMIANFANGDARSALTTLEMAVLNGDVDENGKVTVTRETVESCTSKKSLLYDKNGEEHYNLISALHKSMRNSDPDAAVYWLARMLEAGEDPIYIARRVTRFASEDVGLADVVHRQDEVVGVILVQQLERLGCRAHAGERGGIREVEFEVLLVNLRLDVAVLLEDVAVVAAADQQNLVNPVFHEAVGLPALGQPLFGGILHGSRFRHCRIYKYKDKGRDIQ